MCGARDVGDAGVRLIQWLFSQLDPSKRKHIKQILRNFFMVGGGGGRFLSFVLSAVVANARWGVIAGDLL